MVKAASGWYTFAVPIVMSKPAIAGEAAKRFKVTVREVRTASMHGKTRRVGRRMKPIRKPDWKKAFIKVQTGQKIDAFQVTEGEKKV